MMLDIMFHLPSSKKKKAIKITKKMVDSDGLDFNSLKEAIGV